MIVTLIHKLFSTFIVKLAGKKILNVFSRVITLILASLAIQFVIDGLKSSFLS